jgi:hypothetical protein
MLKSTAFRRTIHPAAVPDFGIFVVSVSRKWELRRAKCRVGDAAVTDRSPEPTPLTNPTGHKLNMRLLAAAGILAGFATLVVAAPAAPVTADALLKPTEESRKLAQQVSHEMSTQLIREMQLSGPVRSLLVCKYTCPEILSAQSRRTGWRVAAVSLKPRNSALGTADAWEQKVIADFARRAAKGEKEEALELVEIVSEPQARYFRYARAMMVEPLCLSCHSSRDKLPEAVKAQLAIDYPFDRAVDFRVGEVYGVVSIKRAW